MNETFTEKQMMEEAVRNIDNISQGNIISGKIVKVTQEDVFVDIGYKSEGKINFSEFEKIKIIPVEGMEIQAKIMRLDDSRGNIVLSYLGALEKQSWEKLLDAHANKKPIIVTIEKEIKGGYSVKFEKTIDMFMPKSQLAGIDGNPEGQAVEVAVIEIDKNKKNIVVSKRELEDSKKRIVWENLFEGKSKGDLIKGRVSRIVDFGAFVDFGGLEGLLHSSDLSWGRVEKVEDFVKTGDEVEVVILDMKKNRFQVSLGLKQKSPEPWKIIQDKYNTGDDVTGKVVSLTKYGAFVALMPGLEGLLHVSDMSWKKIDSPDSILNPGDEVKVRILEIDKENKRISLGIKQLTPDPWEKIDEIAPLDKEVEGKIIKIINSGAILEIINGVEGYIHVSDMSWSRKNSHPQEFVTDGQMVKAKVLEVDKTERKLRLGMKQLTPDPWELAGKNFQTGQTVKGKVTGITKFGAFIEISEGVEGLLHVSDLSWSQKISDVSSVVKEGETIDVMITMLDVENKKLSLGLKQLTEDPWKEIREKYPENSIVEGVVTNIRPFGVFVELADGIEGLLHISDFSWTEKVNNPAEFVKKGQTLRVRVLNYDSEKRQIALGLKQIEENPYSKYTEGLTVPAKVVEVRKFGAKAQLEEGICGFIHVSELSEEHVENVEDYIKVGDEIEVKILENNIKDRVIKLSVKDAQFGKIASEYLLDDESSAGVSVGDKLRKAMKKK